MSRANTFLTALFLACSLSGCKQGLSQASLQQSLEAASQPDTHRLQAQLKSFAQDPETNLKELFSPDTLIPVAITLRCAAYPDTSLQLRGLDILEQIQQDTPIQRYHIRAQLAASDDHEKQCQQDYLLDYTYGRRYSWVNNQAVISAEPRWTLTAYQNLMTQVWRVEALSQDPAASHDWQKTLKAQLQQLGLAERVRLQPEPGKPLQARLLAPFENGLPENMLPLLQQQQGFALRLLENGKQQDVGIDYRDLKTARFALSHQYFLELSLTPAGAEKLKRVSTQNEGKVLGIFLGENLLSAPRIQAPILAGELIIEGGFSAEEAALLTRQLAFKPLPFGLKLSTEQVLGSPEQPLP